MARKAHSDSQKEIDSFLVTTFQYLVERIAPGYFRHLGRIPDEEGVAATEALTILLHLRDERRVPPHTPVSEARKEAEQLFRNRLKWRIKTQAPRWRKMLSLSAPDSPGYDMHDQHPGNQPEQTVILKDTVRRIQKALQADDWSKEEIALYFAYESSLLSLAQYAKALGIGTDAAKQRASRTRKKLQKRLGQLAEPLYAVLTRLLRQLHALHGTMFRHV